MGLGCSALPTAPLAAPEGVSHKGFRAGILGEKRACQTPARHPGQYVHSKC